MRAAALQSPLARKGEKVPTLLARKGEKVPSIKKIRTPNLTRCLAANNVARLLETRIIQPMSVGPGGCCLITSGKSRVCSFNLLVTSLMRQGADTAGENNESWGLAAALRGLLDAVGVMPPANRHAALLLQLEVPI
jgi:hypothetical protein